MTTELRVRNQSQQLYVHALSQAWRSGVQLHDPSLWLLRDPEAEEKMLRDADIAHAIGFRRSLIAGRQWNLVPRMEGSARAPMALSVGTELLGGIRKFTESRRALSRAFFSGSRFARIHGKPRKLRLGDGKVRTWWCPVRLEDLDKRSYRIVPTNDGERIKAHWERWDVAKSEFVPETMHDAIQTIRHVYEDDQATLGHGRALREALGWWWYAKTHVFQESLQAVERFAQGIIHAKVDGLRDGETGLPNTELITAWQNVLEDLRSRHVLVSDKADDVNIISASSEGWQILSEIRNELKTTIFTLVLGANLTTAADSGGSYALAEIQENSTEALIQYDRETLEETLTDDLIGCLWNKNHANLVELGISNEMPRFAITQEKRQDPQERVTVAQALNQMGVPLSATDLYEQTGFAQPEEGETIVEGASQQPPQPPGFGFRAQAGGSAQSRFQGLSFATEGGVKSKLDLVENLYGEMLDKAAKGYEDAGKKTLAWGEKRAARIRSSRSKREGALIDKAREKIDNVLAKGGDVELEVSELIGKLEEQVGDLPSIEDVADSLEGQFDHFASDVISKAEDDTEKMWQTMEAIDPTSIVDDDLRQRYQDIDQRLIDFDTDVLDHPARDAARDSFADMEASLFDEAENQSKPMSDFIEEKTSTIGGDADEKGPGVTRDDGGKFAPGGTGTRASKASFAGDFDESKVKRDSGRFAPQEGAGAKEDEPKTEDQHTEEREGGVFATTSSDALEMSDEQAAEYSQGYGEWGDSLSRAEKKSISEWSTNDYWQIKRVQKGLEEPDRGLRKRMEAFEESLDRAPARPGQYFRGMQLSSKKLAMMEPGDVVTSDTFGSWTSSGEVGTDFSIPAPERMSETKSPVMYRGNLQNAKELDGFSEFPEQEEFIMKQGSQFEIKSINKVKMRTKDGRETEVTIIDVDEV